VHTTEFPAPVQAAIDYGRQLPDTQVCIQDFSKYLEAGWISVEFVLPYGDGDCIELGTDWVPDGDGWRLDRAAYRTFKQNHLPLRKLGSWEEVAAFLAHPRGPATSDLPSHEGAR
jgi:hypothetical protein